MDNIGGVVFAGDVFTGGAEIGLGFDVFSGKVLLGSAGGAISDGTLSVPVGWHGNCNEVIELPSNVRLMVANGFFPGHVAIAILLLVTLLVPELLVILFDPVKVNLLI